MNTITLPDKDFILIDGYYYMTMEMIGKKIGYQNPRKSCNILYNRHKDELKPFVRYFSLISDGQKRRMLVFDVAGCYLFIMLARTSKSSDLKKSMIDELKRYFEYQDIKRCNAKMSLDILIRKNKRFSSFKFKRLIKLNDILTRDELCKVFNMGHSTIAKYFKLYRESQAGFRDFGPVTLKFKNKSN